MLVGSQCDGAGEPKHVCVDRYAITLSVPRGSVRKGVYFDTAEPHHSVRLVEGGDGRKDLLLVSGEEHDQGIKPEEYADYFGRSDSQPYLVTD